MSTYNQYERLLGLMSMFVGLILSVQVSAQDPDEHPHHMEDYHFDFGIHNGNDLKLGDAVIIGDEIHYGPEQVPLASLEPAESEYKVITHSVRTQEISPWFGIQFADGYLGENSFIKMTSTYDQGQQKFDQKNLFEWNYHTAIFNGEEVIVELWVAPGDVGVFLSISELLVGDFRSENDMAWRSQCGPNDDRVLSFETNMGRITPQGCTAWNFSSGAYLTAGHCAAAGGFTTVEYNVPLSMPDGTWVASNPNDQYPILAGTDFDNDPGEIGQDWAVLNLGVNAGTGSNAGLTPHQVYSPGQDFFRGERTFVDPPNVRITGYGSDFDDLNRDNVQQTHAGPYNGETVQAANDVYHSYTVDTEGGNSGSPIHREDIGTGNVAMGIHTNAGCTTSSTTPGSNTGTSFENDELEAAIEDFFGPNVQFVDVDHPSGFNNGGALTPYKTLQLAANNATTGATLHIVEGDYPEAFTFVATGKTVHLRAPVGPVHIGPGVVVSAKPGKQPLSIRDDREFDNTPKSYFGTKVYPNPFDEQLAVEFGLENAGDVRVEITDVTGRAISLVADRYFEAGQHNLQVATGDLAAGIYHISIQKGADRESIRIVKVD